MQVIKFCSALPNVSLQDTHWKAARCPLSSSLVQFINESNVSVIVINARGRGALDGAVSLRDNSCEPLRCVGRTMSITHYVIVISFVQN